MWPCIRNYKKPTDRQTDWNTDSALYIYDFVVAFYFNIVFSCNWLLGRCLWFVTGCSVVVYDYVNCCFCIYIIINLIVYLNCCGSAGKPEAPNSKSLWIAVQSSKDFKKCTFWWICLYVSVYMEPAKIDIDWFCLFCVYKQSVTLITLAQSMQHEQGMCFIQYTHF